MLSAIGTLKPLNRIKKKKYRLLLQGGGVTTEASFDGNNIHFEKPDKILDSLFSQAVFTRLIK